MCESIFYIDDNEFEHYIIESLIKTYSNCEKISFFLKGKDALELLEKNKGNSTELPDIILLDLLMPEFTGWDFLDAFGKLYPLLSKPVKIYVLSSSVDSNDVKRARSYPFVKTFISKPLTQLIVEDFDNLN
jgi:CheY-like chemotaxis protein